jgi:hypothetical protein
LDWKDSIFKCTLSWKGEWSGVEREDKEEEEGKRVEVRREEVEEGSYLKPTSLFPSGRQPQPQEGNFLLTFFPKHPFEALQE